MTKPAAPLSLVRRRPIRHFGFWILDFGLLLAVGLSIAGDAAAAVTSFADIRFWVGSGEKHAAIVLDWNGDSSSDAALAWGFRWSGAATGDDMLRAMIAADPRLYAKLGSNGPLGTAVRGLGYDANDDGEFALDDDTMFDADGIAPSGPSDGVASIDPEDLYGEGWFTAVWNYATANANPWTGGWTFSRVGPTGRALVDGAWDSWAFTPTFQSTAFAANAFASVAPADFNSDGQVDGADLLHWQQNIGAAANVTRSLGDATGDGQIDQADLAAWGAQFTAAAPVASPSAAAPSHSTPEPLSTTTCASAMFVLLPLVRHFTRRVS